jgi:hypothetical protein
MKWLLEEGHATITDADEFGNTALLTACAGLQDNQRGAEATVQYPLEFGGASIAEVNDAGTNAWDSLKRPFAWLFYSAPLMNPMLPVFALRGPPPVGLENRLSYIEHRVLKEGARICARLPAYLAQRQDNVDVLLAAQCMLQPPLRTLIHGYEKLTTTEELWATGLSADSFPSLDTRAQMTILLLAQTRSNFILLFKRRMWRHILYGIAS